MQRGAGLGWHGPRVEIPARRVLGGTVPWHRPSLVRDQLGRRRSGGSPASRGFAGLGVTGLSAARLRAVIAADAVSARRQPPCAGLTGSDPARPPHPASGLLTSGRRSANGPTAGRCHRTPRRGLGRGLRAGLVTRRSRSVSPCQSRSRLLAPARARSVHHGASRLAVPALAR